MNDLAIGRLRRALASGWAVESVEECTLSLDLDGTVVWAGPGVREVLGWWPEDLTGNHVSVLTPRAGGDLYEAQLSLLLAGEDVGTFVDLGVKRDGRTFKAAVTLEPVRSAWAQLTGVSVVVRDVSATVTGRRKQEPGHRGAGDAVVVTGSDFTVRYATPGVAEMLGYAEDVAFRCGAEVIHPADHPTVTEAVDRLLADPARTERLEVRLRDRLDRWRWIEALVTNRLDDPDVRGLVADLRDVTEKVRAEDELRLSRALHQAMVETAEEGIVVTDPDGAAMYANPAMALLLGTPLEQLYGRDVVAMLGAGDEGWAAGQASWRREVAYPHPDGYDRTLEVAHTPLAREGNRALGSLVMVTDVTETRRAESALRHRALYDSLTGLPNRYLVLDRLEMAAARHARADGAGTAVLFLDLDDLKPINDRHGHQAGDELLRHVATRLARAVRATDTVGRHGGDEFVIICEDIDEADALSVAARVQDAVCRPVRIAGGSIEVSISIGVAMSPPCPMEDLVQQADAAMYHAKQHGGGRFAVAHGDGGVSLHLRLAEPPA